MLAWLDKLARWVLVPMPCCGRRVWGDLYDRTAHRLYCGGLCWRCLVRPGTELHPGPACPLPPKD